MKNRPKSILKQGQTGLNLYLRQSMVMAEPDRKFLWKDGKTIISMLLR